MKQKSLFKDDNYTPNPKDFKKALEEEFLASRKPLPPLKSGVKRKSRADSIFLPEETHKIATLSLGGTLEHVKPFYPDGTFPRLSNLKTDVINILYSSHKRIGLDFEFSTKNYKPSIIGVAIDGFAAACRYDEDCGKALSYALSRGVVFVGHFVLGADKEVLDKALNINTLRSSWEDSMILHYLSSAALCKNPTKSDDGEGAMGFMSLDFATHLWTNIPGGYKHCRGIGCFGPCPSHRVFDYCAVDAYAGLEIANRCWEFMESHNIPRRVYDEHAEITLDFCIAAERRGIHVNRELVAVLDQRIEEKKEALFPPNNERFNPRSNIQVVKWFNDHGVKLKDAQKGTIQTELSNRLEKYTNVPLDDFDEPEILNLEDRALFDVYIYKTTGKGVDPWFAAKYFGLDGLLHPRFNSTGASTLRFSSSKPNFQNLKSGKGWGKEVKKCIIPPPGKKFVSSDASNLEFRICLQNAGVDPKDILKDAFTWLVQQAKGAFKPGAERLGWSERDLAKMVSHGGNYLAGLKLYDSYEIGTPQIRAEVDAGALLLYEDWIYCNKIVGFTGIRIAQALFNYQNYEAPEVKLKKRKDALELQKPYFDNFPIRSWHRSLLAQAERGYVQTRWGSYLELIEDETENAKIAAAKIGQGEGAEYVQGMQLQYLRSMPKDVDMIAQVHDEILFAVPIEWTEDQIRKFVAPLSEEYSHRLPGFLCPWVSKVGLNWGEVVKLEEK